jgi:hypothetical protein
MRVDELYALAIQLEGYAIGPQDGQRLDREQIFSLLDWLDQKGVDLGGILEEPTPQ